MNCQFHTINRLLTLLEHSLCAKRNHAHSLTDLLLVDRPVQFRCQVLNPDIFPILDWITRLCTRFVHYVIRDTSVIAHVGLLLANLDSYPSWETDYQLKLKILVFPMETKFLLRFALSFINARLICLQTAC